MFASHNGMKCPLPRFTVLACWVSLPGVRVDARWACVLWHLQGTSSVSSMECAFSYSGLSVQLSLECFEFTGEVGLRFCCLPSVGAQRGAGNIACTLAAANCGQIFLRQSFKELGCCGPLPGVRVLQYLVPWSSVMRFVISLGGQQQQTCAMGFLRCVQKACLLLFIGLDMSWQLLKRG